MRQCRQISIFTLCALFSLLLGIPAHAHHGWTGGDTIELSGEVVDVELGNPHGELVLDVEGTAWTVEVGQPWRNERAGLAEGDLATGVEIRVSGEHSGEHLLKAEQLWIDDQHYVLYPDRI
ncbi:DUF6152 family protein [Aidingimonas halophila]|uniref:DUF5666 domain-containing protein n=1 Tax=Aidingimonas halophila TaxID=574349 RepID=A0A1H3FW20_9GAMM|nr:DUF6152 family protein [Aidingimonas halophila]GHC39182.1 hypothetical protein GCM10008094_35860 [Aidingimonas halophila]SDX95025.1 hypothetical protein SAMN05443545_108159 [Aidingimonas halophila]